MSNLIIISTSAAVALIIATITVANPGNGIGWECSVSDSTMGMNKTTLTLDLASVVGMDLLVLLFIMCYYHRCGRASSVPCVFASGRGKGYVTPQNQFYLGKGLFCKLLN
jgi:hypothetical protein